MVKEIKNKNKNKNKIPKLKKQTIVQYQTKIQIPGNGAKNLVRVFASIQVISSKKVISQVSFPQGFAV